MKRIINSGIYEIDWQGDNEAEFIGNHPTLILKSVKNKKMYYMFPLTTYTEERWDAYKASCCCRIASTNSIVRIDKVKVLHESQIKHRWIKNDLFIIPTPDEIRHVYQKYVEYISNCITYSISDYQKYYKKYDQIIKIISDTFLNYNFSDEIVFDFDKNIFTFNMKLASKLSFDDVKHILFSYLGKENISVSYRTKESSIVVEIVNKNLLLTIKENYDKVKLAKGNVNKTSA